MWCLWFPWGTSYVKREMHNNWHKDKHISLGIADYSLSSPLTCCYRCTQRMWDRTTYPLTLLVQTPASSSEGGDTSHYPNCSKLQNYHS